MNVQIHCPTCKSQALVISLAKQNFIKEELKCQKGHTFEINWYESLQEKGIWEACPVCDSRDAYLVKNVPKRLFLGILIAVLTLAFYLLSVNWYLGMGVLFSLAAIDFLLYQILSNVVVCYTCQSEFRGIDKTNTNLKPYDPHVGERYRQKEVAQNKTI